MKKSTTESADQIHDLLTGVTDDLLNALRRLREIEKKIIEGENEPDFKLPIINNIKGAVSLAASASSLEQTAWSGYANARRRR